MKNTNKESKLQEVFKDTNHKLSMILNAITAAIWVFITAMNLYYTKNLLLEVRMTLVLGDKL